MNLRNKVFWVSKTVLSGAQRLRLDSKRCRVNVCTFLVGPAEKPMCLSTHWQPCSLHTEHVAAGGLVNESSLQKALQKAADLATCKCDVPKF